ncbi:MAG: YdbH domain-containing protein [Robiginitomaculum sp.]|nr:YdbH domain-containing protein [Robiginitomaculum sp.]
MSAALLGLFTLFGLIWVFRYDLIEYKLKRALAKNGLTTEMQILSMNATKAVLGAVHISKNGQAVLSVDRLELEYEVEHALKGRFDKISLHRLVTHITLDGAGNVMNDWWPRSSRGGQFEFPKNGVSVEDAQINWHSPIGDGLLGVSGTVNSPTNWSFVYEAADVQIQKDGLSVNFDISGGAVQKLENKVTVFGTVEARSVAAPTLKSEFMNVDFKLNLAKETSEPTIINGWINIAGDTVDTAKYLASRTELKLDIDTVYHNHNRQFGQFTADWDLKFVDVVMKEQAERQRLARVLTSYNAMSKTPIAMYFADILPRKLENLFEKFSVKGRGNVRASQDGYEIHLKDNFLVTGLDQIVTISSKAENAILYTKPDHNIMADLDIDWSGANGMQIKNFKAQAESLNGVSLEYLRSLSAHIQMTEQWRRQIDGQNFRLSPIDAWLQYRHHGNVRDITLQGAMDYDGLVPSGRVLGLQTQGIVTIHSVNTPTSQQNTHMGFQPQGDIFIKNLTNISGWKAKDLTFGMTESSRLINFDADGRSLFAQLNNVSAQIISPDDQRRLKFGAESIKLQTVFGQFPQIWDFGISEIEIFSQDFPAPGTHIRVPHSQINIEQNRQGELRFSTKNPDTYIETDNVVVDKINIDLRGAPDDFNAVYSTPKVVFKGGNVPRLPLSGTARFQRGTVTGQAVAYLPAPQKGESALIDISFKSLGGRGAVKIDIPKLAFSPNGLQPQSLVPALRGKIADVEGLVSAELEFSFGGGVDISSSGQFEIFDLGIGTLVGPMQGVNAQLNFSSIFPLKTSGIQTASLASFDPGFPLQNGQIRFEILPTGIRILEAIWPVAETSGQVYIAPMLWKFGNVENRPIIHIENIDLGKLLGKASQDKLSVTGLVSGILPAKISGVNVSIEDGKLAVKDGGIIRFKTLASDAASARNEYAGHGLKALENLSYKKLEARINGPLDGSVNVDLVLDGHNPDVLNGQNFLFNVAVEGELANIARNLSKSFSTQENLKRVLEIRTDE